MKAPKKISIDAKIHGALMYCSGGSSKNRAHTASLMASIAIGTSLFNAIAEQVQGGELDSKTALPMLEDLRLKLKALKKEFEDYEGIAK